ncbi:MAG: hypothetical protein ACFE0P_13570 [Oceanicaulis sp.]
MQAAIFIATFLIALLVGSWLGAMIWEQTKKSAPRLAFRIGGAAIFGACYILFQVLNA